MEAEELRINNYIQFGNKLKKVVEITENSFYVLDEDGTTLKNTWAYLKPIPLTEEWLIKFEKINWLYKDTYGYYTTFNNKRIYFRFVHSLQNFYFCVEQKELQ